MNILDQILWDVRTDDDFDQYLPSKVVLRIEAYLFCETYAIHTLLTNSIEQFMLGVMGIKPIYLIERPIVTTHFLNCRAIFDALWEKDA